MLFVAPATSVAFDASGLPSALSLPCVLARSLAMAAGSVASGTRTAAAAGASMRRRTEGKRSTLRLVPPPPERKGGAREAVKLSTKRKRSSRGHAAAPPPRPPPERKELDMSSDEDVVVTDALLCLMKSMYYSQPSTHPVTAKPPASSLRGADDVVRRCPPPPERNWDLSSDAMWAAGGLMMIAPFTSPATAKTPTSVSSLGGVGDVVRRSPTIPPPPASGPFSDIIGSVAGPTFTPTTPPVPVLGPHSLPVSNDEPEPLTLPAAAPESSPVAITSTVPVKVPLHASVPAPVKSKSQNPSPGAVLSYKAIGGNMSLRYKGVMGAGKSAPADSSVDANSSSLRPIKPEFDLNVAPIEVDNQPSSLTPATRAYEEPPTTAPASENDVFISPAPPSPSKETPSLEFGGSPQHNVFQFL